MTTSRAQDANLHGNLCVCVCKGEMEPMIERRQDEWLYCQQTENIFINVLMLQLCNIQELNNVRTSGQRGVNNNNRNTIPWWKTSLTDLIAASLFIHCEVYEVIKDYSQSRELNFVRTLCFIGKWLKKFNFTFCPSAMKGWQAFVITLPGGWCGYTTFWTWWCWIFKL